MKRIGLRTGLGWAPALGGAMMIGCAVPPAEQPSPQMAVWARSHNRSQVDVYLMCGDRDAQWLGVLQPNEAGAFEFPSARTQCTQGLNFFLVDRNHKRGYWVGPMYPQNGSQIDLVIEKYAGLSSASLGR
ncbi:MAG: hypothetical protein ACJ8AQ_01905 [Gemmatimonadales bacterium]